MNCSLWVIILKKYEIFLIFSLHYKLVCSVLYVMKRNSTDLPPKLTRWQSFRERNDIMNDKQNQKTAEAEKLQKGSTSWARMRLMVLDRIIHESARLRIMMILSGIDKADFNFLLSTLGLSKGNLSRHVEKLELAHYVKVSKTFKGKIPNTCYQLTKKGTNALTQYWKNLDVIRRTGQI